jgi:hypothetical protein
MAEMAAILPKPPTRRQRKKFQALAWRLLQWHIVQGQSVDELEKMVERKPGEHDAE